MPRKKKPVDPALVGSLASIGCTMEEIAAVVGVSVDTLERRFADTIEKGRLEARASLRRKQVQLALAGNVTMLIWLGKQLLGQRDQASVETTGKAGGPIQVQDLTAEERQRRVLALLERGGR